MSHQTRSLFFCALLLSAFSLVNLETVWACSCGPNPTVLDSYEHATQVIIAKAVAVEKIDPDRKPQPDEQGYDSGEYSNIRSTTMQVEKVFKGTLKVGEEIKFAQGGSSCSGGFSEKDIGTESLFYLYSQEKQPKFWHLSVCGRSAPIKYATDDLLYLNNIAKVRGKTRISGTLGRFRSSDFSFAGRAIRIIGATKTYQAKTDQDGVYEIYGLPPGKYLIEPESPKGWKVDEYWLRYSPNFIIDDEDTTTKRTQIPIMLEAKKHASLDIHFEIDNSINGKLFDPSGKPMVGVCLQAVHPEAAKKVGYHADCTDENGAFSITEMSPGEYILAINEDGKISSDEPFPTFFYPNVLERDRAAVFNIQAGDMIEGINIYAPKMEELVTITGLLLYADGKPVIDEEVEFTADKVDDTVDGDAEAKTDERGRFSIKLLKGLKGSLQGQMYTYIGEFENCPKLDALIKKTSSGNSSAELKTPELLIATETNLDDLELRFSFPSCKKAK